MTGNSPALVGNAGRWRIVTIDDENTRNSISRAAEDTIASEFEACCKTGIPLALHGKGRGFSSGANLHELLELDSEQAYLRSIFAQKLLFSIAKAPIHTLAFVHSYCIGKGFELALACRTIAASSDAQFSFPEASYGFEPGSGGLKLLECRCGHETAMEIFRRGRKLSADEAFELGIVDIVLPSGEYEMNEQFLEFLSEGSAQKRPIPAMHEVDEQLARRYAMAVSSEVVKQRLREKLAR